jgi:twinkle protein
MNVGQLIESVYIADSTRAICPFCTPTRKKQNEEDFVITRTDNGYRYYCHHCHERGFYNTEPRGFNVIPMKKEVPVVSMTSLQPQHLDFLISRGISESTAKQAKLFSAEKYFRKLNKRTESIAFPYFKDGKYVSAKYRSIEGKDFIQDEGGAHDFFGIDDVDVSKPVVIVEGEMDALSLMECGFVNVLSVPNGAPMAVKDGRIDASEDKKFAFVWNANEVLSKVPYVIIATDNDPSGQALAEELARRIGKDKCRIAKSEYKDLNEVLLAEGIEKVKEIIDNAEPYPVSGLSSPAKFLDRLNDLWNKGTNKGVSTGFTNVDTIYTVAQSQLTVVTGYPSSGKSNFIDQLMVNLARNHDWKFAVCSFENQPEIHISRFMEIYTEKRFFDGKNRMTEEDKELAFKWVENHFIMMDSETIEPTSIDSVLERARIAVTRMGIRGLVIDPYNYIENKTGGSEHEFISNMLTKIQAFAKAFDVHVWFIAHPSKITRSGMDLPRPDGMAISGSMAWWAKADNGITVHRAEHHVEIAVWKCRYRWIGTQGETKLEYVKNTGTYMEIVDDF